ncbi:HPP family protein [Paenibacillus radicis (ex Xue et al. 2023)]|uniref:HPP family protein n=1 Tax=Paenibacillus radicis (ex Xue et al. 2023) TaxID=2972489 RepID=A0ABT1YQB3_9BACL|nr:HPP family protein [Paenibacillus radicis (ex Xue et al. 2023)]MCR8634544.1 HPP family protein [Paenibacillus radicis (ex Xue et al. 2023)]
MNSYSHPLKALLPSLGGFTAILLCSGLGGFMDFSLIMAPFGATCVLIFALPESPLSQPRNIIGGHLLSTLVGLICLTLFGTHTWSIALAVGLAIGFMQWTRTLHPPAGADPLVVMLSAAAWKFLITPVLMGAVLIVAVAYFYHKIARTSSYPRQWW